LKKFYFGHAGHSVIHNSLANLVSRYELYHEIILKST